jgi:hypothetical protein
MTATAVIKIVKWGAELVKAVVDAITESVKGPEPPTLEKLKANAIGNIQARTKQGDWLAADAEFKKAADAEFIKAADEAHDDDGTP